jgi:DNA-binding response OmpR family regulator
VEAEFVFPARYVSVGQGRADLPSLVAAASALTPTQQNPTRFPETVLLVEDSLLIAMDVEALLGDLGAKTVLTAASVRHARDHVAAHRIDFAILDVNLGSETSLSLADELRARNIPFAFASGYGEQAQLTGDDKTVVITKPYGAEEIAAAWRALKR